ncbi:Signal recognition particle subunit SRP68 [Apiospora kogelbergensis]|uniref:Signal recognition particle subunit SRP68 n=1 Tax=Apiospora kogelbergensis TaxID=1337665 RepID=A0AAW0QNW5_9PEZI
MDITEFIVSSRNAALLYGDYSTYHRQSTKKLANCRRKLGLATKNRGKFTKKGDVTADQISQDHAYLHLLLLTSERAWAHGMELKAIHSTDTKGLAGHTRSHIVSRITKGACNAEAAVELLSQKEASGASLTDILEARAYASMIRGAAQFENRSWEPCVKSYAVAHIIYSALASSQKTDTYKDLLSETIEPSIRYAAYQIKVPRTLTIPTIARKAFPNEPSLVEAINQLDSDLLKQSSPDAQKDQADALNAPQTISWRGREVKIEDAAIGTALASTDVATSKLAEKLSSSEVALPKEMAAAYDDVLIASQDATDATKRAIEELKEEGVSQNDSRIQSLQITRTAVNYKMISWRIGRNRVLSGEHDGALLDSAPNTTRKAKKEAGAKKPKNEAPGRKIARLKEKVVLYDATLQSLDSIRELPGVASDDELLEQLDATRKYFHALKCLSVARSHSLAGNSVNALALTKHAHEQCEASAKYFAKNESSSSGDASPQDITIRQREVQFLSHLLSGELQRCRALVEIDNLRAKAGASGAKSTAPLVERLFDYPAEGAVLENLVAYPPKVNSIPVKPLFLDVAWNYIDYQDSQTGATTTKAVSGESKDAQSSAPQKRGWFGFGRG